MSGTALYWFRNDLRLHDAPALWAAAASSSALLPVVCLPPRSVTAWGFERVGVHRRVWWEQAVAGLAEQLRAVGSDLLVCQGPAAQVLPALAQATGTSMVYCEAIGAPEEEAEIDALRASGLRVQARWQSTLFEPASLPFGVRRLPPVFSSFRQQLERQRVRPAQPLPVLSQWPALPGDMASVRLAAQAFAPAPAAQPPVLPQASSFPYTAAQCHGGETAALAFVQRYLDRRLALTYKATRNGLQGLDYSTKWSPWLASGALSVREAQARLTAFEQAHGANEGTAWITVELLWRDYFRWLHLQHGRALYREQGLSAQPMARGHVRHLQRWCEGRTGEPLVDAAMRELRATGYLSNRLRQVAASFWLHELEGDWRAGAAWYESQLIDYDVYSNQGNWLYIAGRGTDPRGGRRFNPAKQAADYDPDGRYRALWGTA
jgi:deoxyribodipyrimidine photo-lyase